jgi:MbtH protein
MANPFEDSDASYYVLMNAEGQYSLWPGFADVPDGWRVIFGEAGRPECLEFIEQNWTDMRPKSLITAMEAMAAGDTSYNPPATVRTLAEEIAAANAD